MQVGDGDDDLDKNLLTSSLNEDLESGDPVMAMEKRTGDSATKSTE